MRFSSSIFLNLFWHFSR